MDKQVKSWYDQIMAQDQQEDPLFAKASWELPEDNQIKLGFDEPNYPENPLDLNLEDPDLKFCFPNLEASNDQTGDQAVVLAKPFSLDDNVSEPAEKEAEGDKTGSDGSTIVKIQLEDFQHTTQTMPRKLSDASCSKPVESSNVSTKDNETDTKSEKSGQPSDAPKDEKTDENFVPDMDNFKPEDDPDFYYKAPRKQKFEYNKRKDVILKTILRKCRRTLQDKFNDLTGYFPKKKTHGSQFLKDCIIQFHDSLETKPEQLDLVFYLGAMLYPQEMGRGVDCFFEADKKERVKFRKVYRAKIQKVHDVLYRYSHEKMDYFTSVPELCFLYTLFYKEEIKKSDEDVFYMNGATEIFQRCFQTLADANISV